AVRLGGDGRGGRGDAAGDAGRPAGPDEGAARAPGEEGRGARRAAGGGGAGGPVGGGVARPAAGGRQGRAEDGRDARRGPGPGEGLLGCRGANLSFASSSLAGVGSFHGAEEANDKFAPREDTPGVPPVAQLKKVVEPFGEVNVHPASGGKVRVVATILME